MGVALQHVSKINVQKFLTLFSIHCHKCTPHTPFNVQKMCDAYKIDPVVVRFLEDINAIKTSRHNSKNIYEWCNVKLTGTLVSYIHYKLLNYNSITKNDDVMKVNKGKWKKEEDAFLEANPDKTAKELSLYFNRTTAAVSKRRSRLKAIQKEKEAEKLEFIRKGRKGASPDPKISGNGPEKESIYTGTPTAHLEVKVAIEKPVRTRSKNGLWNLWGIFG